MPKKPNPNSQKVVVREIDLEKWDTTVCRVCRYESGSRRPA